MSHHRTRTLRIAAAWAGIALTGLAVGWFAYRGRHQQMRTELMHDAVRSAVALDPRQIAQLAGTRDDLGTPGYAAVEERLHRLRAVQPRVRSLYILRFLPASGRLIHLCNSAPGQIRQRFLPGDKYPAAAGTAGLQEIIRTGAPAVEGPVPDAFGTWVTGYALVDDVSAGAANAPREILALDVDAAHWRQALWQSGFQGAFYTWVMFGLPFVAWLVSRREGEQREVIRNLSEAMEQSHSSIMIVDLDGRIEYANRGLCRQLGYPRRELIGRDWREIRGGPPADPAYAELLATVRSGRAWEGEWSNQRRDGSSYPVRGVVTPVKHRDGSFACYAVVFDDVTETKRKEDELREARDLAEAGDRAKGHFLATMSHEVRTPLNGIVGFTSLLLETPLSAEQRDYVQTIRMSTEALIQLTGDILDFARIESGKLKLEPLPCDPRECIEDALDLLAARAAEKGLELLHHIGEGVPAAVLTDGGRLRQVLVNLIGNAVKFTEKGEVEVSVAVENGTEKAKEGKSAAEEPDSSTLLPAASIQGGEVVLVFTVRDTGIGIAAPQHPKLFKPFSQVDDSTTRRYSGTGLGLAISRNLVRLMGGEIGFVSEAGRGSTFTFTIHAPIAAPDAPVRELPELRVAVVARPGTLRRELVQLLTGWRAQVLEVSSASELRRESDWHATIVDVNESLAHEVAGTTEPLPGVRQEKAIGLVPVSLSTDLRAALRTHFRSLLNKPVHHDALFALLSGTRSNAPMITVPPAHFGFRVLLVEDNPVNQRLMQRVLGSLGCSWRVVDNGRMALAELAEHAGQFDVILLDLHMPEMDGLTALKEIRSGNAGLRAQAMWIIALTADAREEQRTRAMASGLDDYLTKPVKLSDVEAALKRFRAERTTRKR